MQDFSCRRLLIQRLADLGVGLSERLVLLLQLPEQPHILNSDDRLISKGVQQLDLALGERRRGISDDYDRAERTTPVSQWDADDRTATQCSRRCARLFPESGVNEDVGRVHDGLINNRATRDCCTRQWEDQHLLEGRIVSKGRVVWPKGAMRSDDANDRPVHSVHSTDQCVGKTYCRLCDRV